MKVPVLVVFTVLAIQCSECSAPWSDIFHKFLNKTSHLLDFVKTKGRSVKQFYVDSVRGKLTTDLAKNNNPSTEYDKESFKKQLRIKRKFKDYIEQAEAAQNQVFDSIAQKKVEYDCEDDDPAIHMTTPQLIALHGYHAESHTVVTEDGYILTIHRIPFAKKASSKISPQKTVLLHHGLLGSSADWIIPGPRKGLPYILAELGYDVWLANVRGNTYSRAHVSKNTDSFAFWNFTFHEVSQYDLPAVIDYIMGIKNGQAKINYIGHSMGTTALFAMLSTKTEYNNILRAGFALAPVAFMTNLKSPIRLLATFSNDIEYLMKLLGANEFLPQNSVLRWLSKHACEINHYEEAICENSLFVVCGYDEKQFNRSLLPIILGHVPAGASTRTLIHYAQEIKNKGRFQMFDFGPSGNFKLYGTINPPKYPVHEITLPIALFSSDNDLLASDIDVTNLYIQLANPIEHYVVPFKEFNHMDFLWAIDAPTLVYDKLLQLLEEGVRGANNSYGGIDANFIGV
ncbi:Acid lipase-2 [Operophtera brumata]|uniref:Acid lipase-2 n=1 Tax=Operophtera brumata TaxID=104452 RepID=A0A0L7LBN2_OPEBR|nr:Acid lipase-2 [Operophtera brumata]